MAKGFFLVVFLVCYVWIAQSLLTSGQARVRAPQKVLFQQRCYLLRTSKQDFDRAVRHQAAPVDRQPDGENEGLEVRAPLDSLVKETSLNLRRIGWLSWWAQVILTTVSSVTLLFARNVIESSNAPIAASNVIPNFLSAGTGIALSFVSIFWTWASRRLARRLLKKPTSRIQTANMLRKSVNVGVTINIIGMLITIIGAEQIVGILAVKVLTTARTVTLMDSSVGLLQPLDILVVQANTNTLFSHFSSLSALLYLSKSILKLDPPSVEGDERRR